MEQNLDYYYAFAATVKAGSITAAAAELNISQPALSQKIRQLEEGLGTRLFVRTARGVRLTREGEILSGYVARGLEQIETGEQKLRQMLQMDLGELHIGASDMTLHFYLLPWLEHFHELHPKIKMSITNAPTPETIELLEKNRIDFGVVSGPLDELLTGHQEIRAIPVRQIQDVFVAGSRYQNLRDRSLEWKDIVDLPLIVLEETTASRRFMDRFLSERGVVLHPEFELATSDMIVQFAERNLGVGCVMEDFAAEALERRKLFRLTFRDGIPARQFYVILNREELLPQAAKGLLELIGIAALV